MKTIFGIMLMMISFSCFSNVFEKPVQIILPFPPGGSIDTTFRSIQQFAEKQNLHLMPVYRPGAEGVIGLDRLSESCTDGRCISLAPLASIAQHRLHSNKNSENVSILTNVKIQPNSFVINTNIKEKTIKDITSKMNNGYIFKIGQGSPGSRIAAEQFLYLLNNKKETIIVPYKGASPMMLDLLGNNIDIAVAPFTVTRSHVDAKRVNLLFLTSLVKFKEYETTYIFDVFPTWKNYEGHIIVYPKNMEDKYVKFWSWFFQRYLNDQNTIQQNQKDYNVTPKFGDIKNIDMLINDIMKKL